MYINPSTYKPHLLPIILEHAAPAAWRSLLQRSVDRANTKVFYVHFVLFFSLSISSLITAEIYFL